MRISLRIVTLIVLGCGVAMTVRGQSPPTTPGGGGRNDRFQRELQQQFEMRMIEQALMESRSKPSKQYPPRVLDQIREDFLRIQVVDRKLMQATAVADRPDLELVSKSAGEIRKRSRRLKTNLALPRPETPPAERREISRGYERSATAFSV